MPSKSAIIALSTAAVVGVASAACADAANNACSDCLATTNTDTCKFENGACVDKGSSTAKNVAFDIFADTPALTFAIAAGECSDAVTVEDKIVNAMSLVAVHSGASSLDKQASATLSGTTFTLGSGLTADAGMAKEVKFNNTGGKIEISHGKIVTESNAAKFTATADETASAEITLHLDDEDVTGLEWALSSTAPTSATAKAADAKYKLSKDALANADVECTIPASWGKKDDDTKISCVVTYPKAAADKANKVTLKAVGFGDLALSIPADQDDIESSEADGTYTVELKGTADTGNKFNFEFAKPPAPAPPADDSPASSLMFGGFAALVVAALAVVA